MSRRDSFPADINLDRLPDKFCRSTASCFVNVLPEAFIFRIHHTQSSQNLICTVIVMFRNKTLQFTNFILHIHVRRR